MVGSITIHGESELVLTDSDGDKLYINHDGRDEFYFEIAKDHLEFVVNATRKDIEEIVEFLNKCLNR